MGELGISWEAAPPCRRVAEWTSSSRPIWPRTSVELDDFIEREIAPLEAADDNIRFFDHRREDARTDWDRGGLPNAEWEALLREARRRADAAGHYRYPFPKEYGGQDGTNLGMAVIREHLARQGPRPALRSAERAHDRREQRRPAC